MKKYLILFITISASVFLSSCESTTTPGPTKVVFTDSTLFMLSEGSGGKNNAELDAYSLKTDTFTGKIINPLGDIGNDIQLFGNKIYVILEGSNKILAVNPDSVADRTSITFPGTVTPYKMAQATLNEVWVTEFKNKQIAILNTASNTLTGTIDIDTAQQDIGILDGKAFVCTNANKLEVIDIATKKVVSNKYIGDSPAQVLIDSAHNSVIVLTYGFFGVSTSKILWVDPKFYTVIDSIAIPAADFVNQMIPANGKAFLTFGDRTDVLDFGTHKISSFIAKPYYKGNYDQISNQLILGDAKDYSSPGSVDIYDASTGTLKKSLTAGVIPGHFLIYRK
jgi:hypothetical protein